jgi:hypothetical protein
MEHVALAGPFVAAGALKIVYDLALYRLFKGVEPPDRALVPEHRSDAQS